MSKCRSGQLGWLSIDFDWGQCLCGFTSVLYVFGISACRTFAPTSRIYLCFTIVRTLFIVYFQVYFSVLFLSLPCLVVTYILVTIPLYGFGVQFSSMLLFLAIQSWYSGALLFKGGKECAL